MEVFKDRNCHFVYVEESAHPKTPWESFKQVVKRSLKGELFVGLWIVLREFFKKDSCATLQYPMEKMAMFSRYRAVHKILRLLESGNERCIGCGLCEKICTANCIRIETTLGEDSRKQISDYTINLGRCIYCGLCADVCPELAIVHGSEYENGSEQRAHYVTMNELLTPLDEFKANNQKEFDGVGSVSANADELIKKTPLAY